MPTPITQRELPEEVMSAMMRMEEEAYRAGQHGCCEESAAKMPNPSVFKACEVHGARCRAALTLLCHALAQMTERIVNECANVATSQGDIDDAERAILELAPRCKTCRGRGFTGGIDFGPPCPDCSRGKAYAHWDRLNDDGATVPRTTGGAT